MADQEKVSQDPILRGGKLKDPVSAGGRNFGTGTPVKEYVADHGAPAPHPKDPSGGGSDPPYTPPPGIVDVIINPTKGGGEGPGSVRHPVNEKKIIWD